MHRHACRLGTLLVALNLEACHSLVDLDVTYKECVDIQDQRYAEEFGAKNLQALRDRCWKVDNEGNAAGGIDKKIFLDDGDLVIRVEEPLSPTDGGAPDLDLWTTTEQAPMVYRRLEGDFVVVARAEAVSQANADHCKLDGNSAGLVVRESDDQAQWATWTVTPFLPSGAACEDDEIETNNPTATVEVRSSDPSWPPYSKQDVGADGEADIAVCRVGSKLYYLYGASTTDPSKDTWLPDSATLISHPVGVGPLDVGLTASGMLGNFQVAGHFNWIVFERGAFGDGCIGALERFELPLGD